MSESRVTSASLPFSSSLATRNRKKRSQKFLFIFFLLIFPFPANPTAPYLCPQMEMDYLYGHNSSDIIPIDDLLDFSNDDIFDPDVAPSPLPESSSSPFAPPDSSSSANRKDTGDRHTHSLPCNFSDDLCVPSDDVAELEWLSKFVEESFSDFPLSAGDGNDSAGNANFRQDPSVPGRARSKRSRAVAPTGSWTSLSSATDVDTPAASFVPEYGKPKPSPRRKETSPGSSSGDGVRRCTHCETDKTPQWRTGPMGPKSLCNACGVRYKSGRLVPEYRPASSPTFVMTQHSNSHRKVMELRRQKEVLRQEKFFQDFKIC